MGWFNGLAATRLDPWVGEGAERVPRLPPPMTPDRSDHDPAHLAWYALLPLEAGHSAIDVAVDAARRAIHITGQGDGRELGFDGFAAGSIAAAGVDRRERRESAYRELRQVERTSAAGSHASALAAAARGVEAAGAAGDPLLGEWTRRVEARALAAAGRVADADRRFEAVAAESGRISEIAWDAGRAFHLAGELERALAWYQRIYEAGASEAQGRGKWEFIEAIVLVLGEQGRWREAPAEVERFQRAYGIDGELMGDYYAAYAELRAGAVPRLPTRPRIAHPDLLRYWALELRRAAGEADPAALLEDVRTERERSSECRPLVRSLEGELLADLGRSGEALAAAREALGGVRFELARSTYARAHFDLVTERFAARARALGRGEEAAAAEAQLRAWRSRAGTGGPIPSGA
jgi:hypothetical protein